MSFNCDAECKYHSYYLLRRVCKNCNYRQTKNFQASKSNFKESALRQSIDNSSKNFQAPNSKCIKSFQKQSKTFHALNSVCNKPFHRKPNKKFQAPFSNRGHPTISPKLKNFQPQIQTKRTHSFHPNSIRYTIALKSNRVHPTPHSRRAEQQLIEQSQILSLKCKELLVEIQSKLSISKKTTFQLNYIQTCLDNILVKKARRG